LGSQTLVNKSVYRLDSRPSPRVRGSGFEFGRLGGVQFPCSLIHTKP